MKGRAPNPKLKTAVGDWVKIALEEYRRTGPAYRWEDEVWVAIGQGHFQRGKRVHELFGTVAQDNILFATPQARKTEKLLRTDPVIGPQMDRLVGSALQRTRLTPSGMLGALAQRIATDGLDWDQQRFESHYNGLLVALYSDTLPHELVAPVPGLTGNFEECEIGQGLTIARMSEEETERALRAGVLRPLSPDALVAVGPQYAIKLRYSLPKVVGDGSDPPDWENLREVDELLARQRERVEDAVNSLRLVKPDPIQLAGHLRYSPGWALGGGGASMVGLVPWHPSETYDLDDETLDAASTMLDRLQSPLIRRHAGTAVRRFGYAAERHRDEDRIMDLMIAAEAACLHSGDETERGEVTYRLSLHVATIAHDADKAAVFDFMKRAYKVRSILVHGGAPKASHLKRLDGSAGELHGFTEDLVGIVRRLLGDVIERVASTGLPIRWDRVVLGIA